MPKVVTSALFDLAHSLTRAEKIYFKSHFLANTKGEKTIYLKLFDELHQQNIYDEISLRKKLQMSRKGMADLKNYLFNLILQSLEEQHCSDNSFHVLSHALIHSRILVEKELYSSAGKIISKSIKLARKYGKTLFEMEFLLLKSSLESGGKSFDTDETFSELFSAISKYENGAKYIRLNSKMKEYNNLNFNRRNPNAIKELKKIYDTPLLKASDNCLSFDALTNYYSTLVSYFLQINDLKKVEELNQQWIGIYEANEHQIIDRPNAYAILLENMILAKLYNYDHAGAKFYIDKTKLFLHMHTGVSNEVRKNLFRRELNYYLLTADIESAYKLMAGQKKFISDLTVEKLSPKKLMDILVLWYFCAEICFIAGDFKESKGYLFKILNLKEKGRQDVIAFSKILMIMIHFELRDYERAAELIKSTFIYLNARERLYKTEKLLMIFFKQWSSNAFDENKIKRLFKDLLIKLMALSKDPMEEKAFQYFNFISWAESKIQGRPFVEIMRKKVL